MKPGKEFSTRYSAAKRWRDDVRPKIEQVMFFCRPGTEQLFSNPTKLEDSSTFISLPEELATDLAGDLITYFTPAEIRWASYEVITDVPEEIEDSVLALVQDREDKLFTLIQASNYNDMAPQWGFDAATHGTAAMWVEASHISMPIHCEAVPPNELLITPGHRGYLDRFRERTVLASTLEALFAGQNYNLSDPRIRSKIEKPGATVKVCWGYWLDWSDPGNPQWASEVTVDGIRVSDEKQIIGPMAGSCPLLVGRFNPLSGRPWGRGAGIKALPDMRVLDKLADLVLSGMEQSQLNTIIYPSDGALDLENGIIAGTAIPAGRNFSRDQIYDFSRSVNVDQGYFSEDRKADELRRAFYQDGPRQRGETPPTAAQWLDERRRVQQRIGKPSAPLWSELILPMIQRFDFLGVQLGEFQDAITHDGTTLNVSPISPLQKAQNQDKVMVTRSNLELAALTFGESLPQIIDMPATLKNIVRASGDELTVIMESQNAAPPPVQ